MVILTEYRTECNDEEENIFVIIGLTVSYCPICGEALGYRDAYADDTDMDYSDDDDSGFDDDEPV